MSGSPPAPSPSRRSRSRPRPRRSALEEHYDDLGCGVFAKDGRSPRTRPRSATASSGARPKTHARAEARPTSSTLELAVSLIDGTGGAADVPRARKLLAGCFADVAVQAVFEHAEKKEKDASAKPLESCEAYAQTTLAMTDCAIEHTQNERAWMRRIRHELAPEARPLLEAATQAYEAYAKKLGEVEYERYAGGTLRSPAMVDKIRFLLHERRASPSSDPIVRPRPRDERGPRGSARGPSKRLRRGARRRARSEGRRRGSLARVPPLSRRGGSRSTSSSTLARARPSSSCSAASTPRTCARAFRRDHHAMTMR